jgi:hypothetical protein
MYGITFSKIKGEVYIFLDKKNKKVIIISLEMRRFKHSIIIKTNEYY